MNDHKPELLAGLLSTPTLVLFFISLSSIHCSEFVSEIFTVDTSTPWLDTDNDGMSDFWEKKMGLSHILSNGEQDPDNDGMPNIIEYNSGTHPLVPDNTGKRTYLSSVFTVNTGAYSRGYSLDTDQDGIPDWWEEKYGLSLESNDSDKNPDGDSRTNLEEFQQGGNPNNRKDFLSITELDSEIFQLNIGAQFVDSDTDGIPDWWEKRFVYNDHTLNPEDDLDGDGLNNYMEYIAGVNPLDSTSSFKVAANMQESGQDKDFSLGWKTAIGRRYRLFWKYKIDSDWQPVGIYTGDGNDRILDFETNGKKRWFFKVDVEMINP